MNHKQDLDRGVRRTGVELEVLQRLTGRKK